MIFRITIFFLFIATAIVVPASVYAVGIGVKPAQISGNVFQDRTSDYILTVFNTANEPGVFSVYSDENNDWFTIEPAEFQLQPNSSKVVSLKVTPDKSGSYAFNLSVVGRSLNRQSFNVASGLKVPLVFTVTPAKTTLHTAWIVGWIVLLLILLSIILLTHRRRNVIERTAERINWLLHHRDPWYAKLTNFFKQKL